MFYLPITDIKKLIKKDETKLIKTPPVGCPTFGVHIKVLLLTYLKYKTMNNKELYIYYLQR